MTHWVKLTRGLEPVYVNLDLARYIEVARSPTGEAEGSRIYFRHTSSLHDSSYPESMLVKESPEAILMLAGNGNA